MRILQTLPLRSALGRATHGLAAVATLLACAPAHPDPVPTVSDGLVFIQVVGDSTEVMRARISDGATQAVTADPDRLEHWPYWSEAAGRLVFQASEPADPNNSDLVLWDPDSGRETMLRPTPRRQERWPAWSPDGRVLAYAFVGGRPASGLVLMDIRRNVERLVARAGTRDFFLRPSFAPVGRRLVAQRREPDGVRSSLWLISAEAPPRRLTGDERWHDSKASFTRDGMRIVFSRRPAAGGEWDVMSIAADGDDLRTIVASAANEHSARPSPTRAEIVYVSNRDGSSQIFLADLDGGGIHSLSRASDGNLFAPRWSPDGERIVMTAIIDEFRGDGSADVETLRNARVMVLDRAGHKLFEASGAMADWMTPWP